MIPRVTNEPNYAGCFTCRLRRKKCDEIHPICNACNSLNLTCEYNQPAWWGNQTQKLVEKDRVKERIRETKVMERQKNLEGESQLYSRND